MPQDFRSLIQALMAGQQGGGMQPYDPRGAMQPMVDAAMVRQATPASPVMAQPARTPAYRVMQGMTGRMMDDRGRTEGGGGRSVGRGGGSMIGGGGDRAVQGGLY